MHEDNTRRPGQLAWLAGAAFLLITGCALEESISAMDIANEDAEAWATSELTTDGVEYTFREIESGDVAQEGLATCPSSDDYDFVYCWLATSVSRWVQVTASYVAVAVTTTDCRVLVRHRVKTAGVWKTIRSMTVLPEHTQYYWVHGLKKPHRVELTNNEGCQVRFAVWGRF